MPRLIKSLPKYRKHRASGQALVTLDGKDFYLGPHGTAASTRQYDRLVGEWQQNGRRLPSQSREQVTVTELLAAYWKFAKNYYVKDGEPTDELPGLKVALRFARQSYGDVSVEEFGPLSLESVQQKMVSAGHSRKYVNKNVGRIKRCFKWGVSKELVPVEVHQALSTVAGLRKGKTEAYDPEPIEPVSDEVVDETLPYLSEVVRDMVTFQRRTGCRPGELFKMRPYDIERSEEVWRYVPASHKTEHHNRHRVIFIGPQAQEILTKYLLRETTSYCFERPSGGQFKRWNYAQAIHRACDKAFPAPEPLCRREGESLAALQKRLTTAQKQELKAWQKEHRWAPNQLRHTAGTEIRKRFGLEAAQVTLGHSNANVTQIYAERDMKKAAAVMREVG
jgi:integrase